MSQKPSESKYPTNFSHEPDAINSWISKFKGGWYVHIRQKVGNKTNTISIPAKKLPHFAFALEYVSINKERKPVPIHLKHSGETQLQFACGGEENKFILNEIDPKDGDNEKTRIEISHLPGLVQMVDLIRMAIAIAKGLKQPVVKQGGGEDGGDEAEGAVASKCPKMVEKVDAATQTD